MDSPSRPEPRGRTRWKAHSKQLDHVLIVHQLSVDAKGGRLGAPDGEAQRFVHVSRHRGPRAHDEMDLDDALLFTGPLKSRLHQAPADSLAPTLRADVHPPDVRFVAGLDHPVAVDPHYADEPRRKGTKDSLAGIAYRSLEEPRIKGPVILKGRSKGMWFLIEASPPHRDECGNVLRGERPNGDQAEFLQLLISRRDRRAGVGEACSGTPLSTSGDH